MISTLKKLQARKAAQGDSGGFTLIELLIVIVVLGILAAVVVFSLGSVTSKSAVSACQSDGATVNTAMAAYNANEGSLPTSSSELLASSNGGPYLQSWPNNTSHYIFSLVPAGSPAVGTLYVAIAGTTTTAPSGAGWVKWTGSAVCTNTAIAASTTAPITAGQPATVK